MRKSFTSIQWSLRIMDGEISSRSSKSLVLILQLLYSTSDSKKLLIAWSILLYNSLVRESFYSECLLALFCISILSALSCSFSCLIFIMRLFVKLTILPPLFLRLLTGDGNLSPIRLWMVYPGLFLKACQYTLACHLLLMHCLLLSQTPRWHFAFPAGNLPAFQ